MILHQLDAPDAGVNHRGLSAGIAAALDFLRRTDLASLPQGKHAIDGDRLFAIAQRYQPRPMAQIIWESHRRYLDVQYVAEGRERMGFVPLSPTLKVTTPYDGEKDCALYACEGDFFHVSVGMFAIFSPQDVHAPGLEPATGEVSPVLKVVVKVAV